MIHQLKCKPEYFSLLINGTKTFEVRKNDRKFHVGDYLAINELTLHKVNADGEYSETGRSVLFYVHYILDDKDVCKEGYVIMGIQPCKIRRLAVGGEPTLLKEE
jgi:hypothetical protein|nr:MAG TPA: activating signal cointegrator [Caudoviricetes sp.]